MHKVLIALLAVFASTAQAQVEEVKDAYRRDLPIAPYKPAPKAAPAVVSAPWTVEVGDITLAKALDRWAKAAGYRVRWDADRHVQISAAASFSGSFEEAVAQVLGTPGIRNSAYPLEACTYPNQPPLVRITRMGDQTNDCSAE